MVFVLPYVLNIQESDAVGRTVGDPNVCHELEGAAAKISRLWANLRKLNADLNACQSDLQTAEQANDQVIVGDYDTAHCGLNAQRTGLLDKHPIHRFRIIALSRICLE